MPTHYKGTVAETTALNAYIKLMRAAESVTSRIHDALPKGLTLTQFAVLETLHHLGPLCQGSLASKLLKSTANLTLVIANLEKAGLIKRERQPDDLRFITISLTPNGRRFIAKLFPKIAARITAEFSVLGEKGKNELCRLAKKLGLQPNGSSH